MRHYVYFCIRSVTKRLFAIVLIRLGIIKNVYTPMYQSILFINLKIKHVE